MKKVLLIIPKDIYDVKYPHLFDFIDGYKKKYEVEVLIIPERGYWIEKYVERLKKKFFRREGFGEVLKLLKFLLALFRKKKNQYEYVISIDNLAYVFACKCLKNKNHVLWSYDFVAEDNTSHGNLFQKKIQFHTKRRLLQNQKLVIQSFARYELFLKSIDIVSSDSQKIDVKYLPVSLKNISLLRVRRAVELKNGSTTLIQIGGINQARSKSCDLISEFQKIDHLKLVLHGFISPDVIQFVTNGNFSKIPIFSNINLPSELIIRLLDNADIAFVSYKATDQNFANISWASGQIAEHTRAGLPIISHGDTSMNDFVVEHNIGLGISDMVELPGAIIKIKLKYSEFSKRSRDLFENKMDISRIIPIVFD